MEEQEGKKKAETEKPKKKKSKFKLIILILFAVICLGAVGVYFLYGHMIMAMISGRATKEGEKVTQKTQEKQTGPILSLEPFLFNIAGTSSKYAKVSIALQMKDHKVMEEAKKITPIIRDRMLTVLGSKTIEVLMDVGKRDLIRQELRNTLKDLFQKETDITAVYITDIMIQ